MTQSDMSFTADAREAANMEWLSAMAAAGATSIETLIGATSLTCAIAETMSNKCHADVFQDAITAMENARQRFLLKSREAEGTA